jgi:hypothetical protein
MPESCGFVNGGDYPRSPPPARRGRPRKPELVDRRCTEPFESVVAAVAKLALDSKLFFAAKAQLGHHADRDRALKPISTKVLRFYLEHINAKEGFDWHPTAAIAEDFGVTVRAVEMAHTELVKGGYILRDREAAKGGRRGAAWRWRTTIPALREAADEVTKTWREAKSPTRKSGRKKRQDPERAADEPRYNRALPLASRITTWPYSRPEGEEDGDLYDRMKRLAKGWDRNALKGEFCTWMEGKAPPNDAMKAFLGWLESTAQRRRPA